MNTSSSADAWEADIPPPSADTTPPPVPAGKRRPAHEADQYTVRRIRLTPLPDGTIHASLE